MQGSFLTIIVFVLLIPLTSQATEIRQRPYSYPYEPVMSKEDEQFVVCSDCPDNRLSKLPVPPKLALRMTAPDKQKASAIQQELKIETLKAEPSRKPGRTETVLFDFDSAQLSSHEQERLAKVIKEFPPTITLDLTGYTCTLGTSAYNEKLSLKRADQVAGFLKANGLNVGKVEGKGECCPASKDKRLNRRVEILEQRKEEK